MGKLDGSCVGFNVGSSEGRESFDGLEVGTVGTLMTTVGSCVGCLSFVGIAVGTEVEYFVGVVGFEVGLPSLVFDCADGSSGLGACVVASPLGAKDGWADGANEVKVSGRKARWLLEVVVKKFRGGDGFEKMLDFA